MGRWIAGDRYFEETDDPYHQERLTHSAFRFNWLAKTENPQHLLEAVAAYYTLSARCRSLQNLLNVAWRVYGVCFWARSPWPSCR